MENRLFQISSTSDSYTITFFDPTGTKAVIIAVDLHKNLIQI